MAISKREVLFYVADYLRILARTQTTIAEYVRIGLDVMEMTPDERARQTELMCGILGASMLVSGGVLTANILNRPDVEHRVFSFLSPPFLFFAFQLFAAAENLSLAWFVGLSVFSWTSSYFFALKTEVVDDAHHHQKPKFVVTTKDFDALALEKYPDVSIAERMLNIIRITQTSLLAFAAVFALITREAAGETEKLSFQSQIILAMLSLYPAYVGYELSDDPSYVRRYLAMPVQASEDGTFVYTAFSAWFALALSQNDITEYGKYYGCVCAFFAISIGLFSAATMHFSFKANHIQNEKIINFARYTVPLTIEEKYSRLKEMSGDIEKFVSRQLTRAGEKLSLWKNKLPNRVNCCASEEDIEAGIPLSI